MSNEKFYNVEYSAWIEDILQNNTSTFNRTREEAIDYALLFYPTVRVFMEVIVDGHKYPNHLDALLQCENTEALISTLKAALEEETSKR